MDDSPPYARIVADIRQRIESGELAPGDRVPSTREITRRWGVAMATATKALGVLRRDGLVRAERGSGTVVEARPGPVPGPGRPRRPAATDGALDPDRIVGAAIAIADREGLAGLSMRRVATDLGAATMALYRHVADKDDLVLRMLDAAMGEWRPPADPPAGWRARLEAAARQLWALFRRHPWLAPAMSMTRPQPIAGGLAYSEWTLAALHDSGVDEVTAFTAYLTLYNYVRGTAVNLEPEVEAEAASGMDPDAWMDTQVPTLRAIVVDGAFPAFERMLATPYDFDLDTLFEFGLQRLLDGFTALLEAPVQASGGPDVTP
ncbi:TetR/AcrR family transcriptional regulator C-terminal domain-containing protein [Pseudonocardia sichuanensis]